MPESDLPLSENNSEEKVSPNSSLETSPINETTKEGGKDPTKNKKELLLSDFTRRPQKILIKSRS